jgi:hypothetical protein
MARKRTLILLQILSYLFLRWWFIPIEFTGDSYGYACEVMKNDLQSGHHLLHKYVLNFLFEQYSHSYFDAEPISAAIYNPMVVFIRFNLIVSVLNLFVIWLILEQRKWRLSSIALALFFLSATFSFMKYSFENETYMLPLFFSLLGTFFYEKKQWVVSFLLLSIATLFHQTHIFWLLALWIHLKIKWPTKILYLILSSSIIITIYYYFSLHYSKSLLKLVFQDVDNGLVQLVPSLNNITMTAVNFIRVFFQVHGEMFMFWKVFNPFLSGVAIISLLFTLIGVVLYIGAHNLNFKKSDWSLIYLTAFFFHLSFAAYSVGNIEFMIVLPFLLVLSHKTGRIMNYSLLVSLGMFLWNFGQFALPRTSVSPHRLHQKLSLISTIEKPESDSIVVAIEDKDLHQNFFEYQRLRYKTTLNILCVELGTSQNTHLAIIHQKSNYTRKSLTSKSEISDIKSNQKIYVDSSLMGNITIITN